MAPLGPLQQGAQEYRIGMSTPQPPPKASARSLASQRWVGWQLAFMDWCMTQVVGTHPREVGWRPRFKTRME